MLYNSICSWRVLTAVALGDSVGDHFPRVGLDLVTLDLLGGTTGSICSLETAVSFWKRSPFGMVHTSETDRRFPLDDPKINY